MSLRFFSPPACILQETLHRYFLNLSSLPGNHRGISTPYSNSHVCRTNILGTSPSSNFARLRACLEPVLSMLRDRFNITGWHSEWFRWITAWSPQSHGTASVYCHRWCWSQQFPFNGNSNNEFNIFFCTFFLMCKLSSSPQGFGKWPLNIYRVTAQCRSMYHG